MDHLVKIMFLVLTAAKRNLGQESDVFEVRIFTNEIHNKSTDASVKIKIYGSIGETVSCGIPSSSSWSEPTSHFGQMGHDVYNVTVKPAIGIPNKIGVTQQDPLKEMSWNLNKVLIIDSKAFYYEFLVNKWLNSSSSSTGEISQEVILFRRYGGPNSVQSRGCIGNGSKVWYRDILTNAYKPAIVTSLSASNATIETSSGHFVTVPRDQELDASSSPLVVNDDWLKLTMALNDNFIAAFNQTGEFYFGISTYVSSKSFTTMISNHSYTWQHLMFTICYTGSNEENHVRGGNIRKVNKMSTSFCTEQDLDHEDDPNTLNVLFTCQNSEQKIAGHVIESVTAHDAMHCGMLCSRHAQCVSFNFCDSSNTLCQTFPSNCELNNSNNEKKSKRGDRFKFCVLLTEF